MKDSDERIDLSLSEKEMLKSERARIFDLDRLASEANALCFSGGGIRSGTFCLGILQGLAKGIGPNGVPLNFANGATPNAALNDIDLGVTSDGAPVKSNQTALPGMLNQFDYLSTVSGGGYVGSWLTRLRKEKGSNWLDVIVQSGGSRGVPGGAETDPIRSEIPAEPDDVEIHPIRRLRSYSNYMSPHWGLSLDGLTVVVVFLLNLVSSLVIWCSTLLFLATLPQVLEEILRWITSLTGPLTPFSPRQGVFFAIPGISGLIWSVTALSQLALGRFVWGPGTNEFASRVLAVATAAALGWLVYIGIFVELPDRILNWLAELSPAIEPKSKGTLLHFVWETVSQWEDAKARGVGLGSAIMAALIGLWGYWSRNGNQIRQEALGISNRLGTSLLNLLAAATLALFCVSIALASRFLTADLAALAIEWQTGTNLHSLPWNTDSVSTIQHLPAFAEWMPRATWFLLAASLALALLFSFLKGANRSSLHGLYANRLTRAYLGSARERRHPNPFTGFDPNDDCDLASLVAESEERPRLVHVVNMTLNMGRNGTGTADWQERKGASFTATPFHVGSSSTRYAPSANYGPKLKLGGLNGNGVLTLGRAMAISGAAVSPNMGYHSAPFVRVIMTVLNVRLGWWLPHPRIVGHALAAQDGWKRWKPDSTNDEPRLALVQIAKEALGFTDERSDWLYLSDGGHFDNLGIYEMIRRRCKRIVVIDAGCDGHFEHADLHIAMTKAYVDFGARIELPPTLPGQEGPGEKQRVVVGKIFYEGGKGEPASDGHIFVVKPILTGTEPSTLLQYALTSRKGNHTFPHHSTGDQFFDETQFERYRQLGEFSARDLIAAMELVDHKTYRPINPNYPQLGEKSASADHPVRASTFAPLVPANDYSQAVTPPPAATTGWESLTATLQSMSTARLLTATVGSVALIGAGLTVGGKVALEAGSKIGIDAPDLKGELRLSSGAESLLTKGVTVKLDGSQLLGKELADLREQVDRLSRIKPGGPTESPDLDEIRQQYAAIRSDLRELLSRPTAQPPVPAVFTDEQRKRILDDLQAIDNAVAGKPAPMLRSVVDQLQMIQNTLRLMRPDLGAGK